MVSVSRKLVQCGHKRPGGIVVRMGPLSAGGLAACAMFFGLLFLVGATRRRTREAIFAVLDWPARLIGDLMGYALFVILPLAAIPVGIFFFRVISESGDGYARNFFASAAGWLAGLTTATILYRSTHWMAFALLERGRGD